MTDQQRQATATRGKTVATSNEIPFLNINSKILSKEIKYCKKQVDSSASKPDDKAVGDELKAWDADFVKSLHLPEQQELIT